MGCLIYAELPANCFVTSALIFKTFDFLSLAVIPYICMSFQSLFIYKLEKCSDIRPYRCQRHSQTNIIGHQLSLNINSHFLETVLKSFKNLIKYVNILKCKLEGRKHKN